MTGITSPDGYDAFISYSHANKAVATALHGALTRIGRPMFVRERVRRLRLFWDDESLPAGSLPENIKQALLRSRYFILLASPEAAQSKWVRWEVKFWHEHCSPENFLIAVVDGETAWGDEDFDWARTNALPEVLRGRLASEPFCIPLTDDGRTAGLSLRRPDFRRAVGKLAAPLHGIQPEDLDSLQLRQQRRQLRTAWSAVSVMLVLSIGVAAASVVAVQQRNRAEQQAAVALSRALAAESQTQRQPQLAAQLAATAFRSAPTAQAAGAMLAALERNRHVVSFVQPPDNAPPAQRTAVVTLAGHAALSPDGSLLAFAADDAERVSLWHVRQQRMLGELELPRRSVLALAFTPDGRSLISHDGGGFQIWDVETRRQRHAAAFEASSPELAVSPDGTLLAARDRDAEPSAPQMWDLRTGAPRQLPEAPVELSGPLAFAPDGRRLLVGQAESAGWITTAMVPLDVGTGSWLPQESVPVGAHLEAIGGGLLVTSENEQLQLRDMATGAQLASAPLPGGALRVEISGDGSTVLVVDSSLHVTALDRGLGDPVRLTEETSQVLDLALSADGGLVGVVSDNGAVSVLSPDTDARVLAHPSPPDDLKLEALAVRGQRAVVAGTRGIRVWNLARGTVERALPVVADPDDLSAYSIAAALDGSGSRLAVQVGGRVGIWDLGTGEEIQRFRGPYDFQQSITRSAGIRFLAGDRAVLVDRIGGPEVVDVASGAVIGKVPVSGEQSGFAVDRDGSTVAVVEDDLNGVVGIHEWDGRTLQRAGEVTGGFRIDDVAVSPDGGRIAITEADNQIFVRDVAGTSRTEMQLPELSPPGGLTFSPDGEVLVGLGDGISFWEVSTGVLIGEWRVPDPGGGHDGDPELTDDGRLVVTRSGAPHQWALGSQQWLAALCEMGVGELRGQERSQYLGGIDVPPACSG
ncbi:WD40 repeat [Saccharopolyspora kobensis]|uniref:WD40 repeat n=1 Tax=Saccharopolyspora kobensis TaxID=146035 RepID=A0A1H5WZN3_9PSEU|nr:TIR domain-containing protein [Saccharopolyspora kobensis]SEG04507.1 WD40 repeat [Saccharopolyspora kobensis]SFD80976.1 WD40 repeat [Saccharopolyspora kobensis]